MTGEERVEAIAQAIAVSFCVENRIDPMSYAPCARSIIAADPLTADAQQLRKERDEAQSLVTAWQGVFESIEAYLKDRIAMQDEASPSTYLSIIQSQVASVVRDGQQIVRARWADYARHKQCEGRLEAEQAQLKADVVEVLNAAKIDVDYKRSHSQTKIGMMNAVQTINKIDALLYRLNGGVK